MSATIVCCIIDIFIKPESIDKVRAVLLELTEDLREQDDCLRFKLLENINNKSQFTLIEEWKTEAALDKHAGSDFAQKASLSIQEDITQIPDMKRYKYVDSSSDEQNTSSTSRSCTLF